MDRAAEDFDTFDALIVSPDLQGSVDRMRQSGLDRQATLRRLAGKSAPGYEPSEIMIWYNSDRSYSMVRPPAYAVASSADTRPDLSICVVPAACD